MSFRLQPCWLAGLLLAAAATAVAAQDTAPAVTTSTAQDTAPGAAPQISPVSAPQVQKKAPHIMAVAVDWTAARAALAAIPALAGDDNSLARLNAATGGVFSNIGASAVPVLLPFDAASFLADKAAGTLGDKSKYMPGYSAANVFFAAGPAGYDASLTLQATPSAQINFRNRVDVLISGSAVIYDLDGAALPEGKPVPELEALFPGIRRQALEDHLRYTFVRFGVPYLVTILCQRSRCRDEEKIGIAFLKSLAVAGGAPQPAADPPARERGQEEAVAPGAIAEPKDASPDFAYYAPGDLLPGTGMRGQSGDPDSTVYADIRFPMAEAPAYVNSQTFMNWGNCDFTGRVAMGGNGRDAQYRCRVNSIPLVRDEARNYAYPWRDNFCEHRYFALSQCPAGLGHQGEDIRPGSCVLRSPDADRCEPYQHNIVAVRDGLVLRDPGDQALYLVVNAPGEHIRFRYLHMDPHLLDVAGMVSGRALAAGEVIGAVDNYEDHQGGTTYHLHFDVQVPTRDGWLFVNPYMTLVAAYERLIGARGMVVNDSMFVGAMATAATPAIDGRAAASPNNIAAPGTATSTATIASNAQEPTAGPSAVPSTAPSATVGAVHHERSADDDDDEPRAPRHRARTAEHCETYGTRHHHWRHCWTDDGEDSEREGRHHGYGFRSMDDDFSDESRGSRHHHGDVHARHAHRSS